MRSPIINLQAITAIIVVLAGLSAFTLFTPVSIPKEGVVFYVRPGISRENLVAELSKNKLLHLPVLFEIYTRYRRTPPRSGEYLLAHGSSPYSIWKQILLGNGRYYRSFTIIPGWTFKQVMEALRHNDTLKHVAANMSYENIMAILGDPAHTPEGMFMPETYNYSRGDPDLVILKRAHQLMALKLTEAWQERAANLPYQDAYQALIAASLIEKEAYLATEQSIIAGVLINRLRKNMLLQFDPTVIYGMGDNYHGKIYKTDLTIDTPYNSYIHKGLPPTPIAMPGMSAIRAAVHPANHAYLYFVAKGNGGHEFTTNLQAHISAVNKAAALRASQANLPAVTGDKHAAQ